MTRYTKKSPQTIQQMFGSIAERYDRTNALLSFNLHKHWNRKLVETVTGDKSGLTMLDLCAGTGDIAFDYLKQCQSHSRAVLLDFCHEMLECASEKGSSLGFDHHTVEYVQGDAQHIPFGESFASCVTIAYGIRNVKDPHRCISEVYRVLQPGGTFGILELTEPENPFLRFGHQIYLRAVLPTVGRLVSSNKEAYTYLCESIHEFIPTSKLEQMLQAVGFEKTQRIPLTGGVATILTAKKPLTA